MKINLSKEEFYKILIHHRILIDDYLESNKNPDKKYLDTHMKIQQTFRYLFQETINLNNEAFRSIDVDNHIYKIINEFHFQVKLNATNIANMQKFKKNILN